MAYADELLQKILSISQHQYEKRSTGQQVLSVDDSPVVTLTPPTGSRCALICVEADATSSDTTRAIRFYESGTAPTSANGFPLGDLDIYEVASAECIANFKMIGIEAGKTHTVQVLYYT